jgi:hypothetical protein
MKIHRLLVALTATNFVLLAFLLAQMRPVQANEESPILRGRGLEITDAQGRVRASITIHRADDNVLMPDGRRGYPETVVLRLIDDNGKPDVKLDANHFGGGLALSNNNDGYAMLLARGGDAELRLNDKRAPETVIHASPRMQSTPR